MQARPATVADSRRQLADRISLGSTDTGPLVPRRARARVSRSNWVTTPAMSAAEPSALPRPYPEACWPSLELAEATTSLTLRCSMPIIVDGAVGFGDAVHVTRMMWEFEAAGAAAVELEDQVAPKRVSAPSRH